MRRFGLVTVVGTVVAGLLMSVPSEVFAGRVEARFGWTAPCKYNRTWMQHVEIFVSPDITDGRVSAYFTAGRTTYRVGPKGVSSGKVVSGGKKKGWRLIKLSTETRSQVVGNLRAIYEPPSP